MFQGREIMKIIDVIKKNVGFDQPFLLSLLWGLHPDVLAGHNILCSELIVLSDCIKGRSGYSLLLQISVMWQAHKHTADPVNDYIKTSFTGLTMNKQLSSLCSVSNVRVEIWTNGQLSDPDGQFIKQKTARPDVFEDQQSWKLMASIPCWSVQWVFQTQHFSTVPVAISTSVHGQVFLGLTPHRTEI